MQLRKACSSATYRLNVRLACSVEIWRTVSPSCKPNPARFVSRGSGLPIDLGRAGSPFTPPAAFTGTLGAGVKRGRYPSPIRPVHLASFRRLKTLVRPRSYPERHRTAAGQCPGPGDQAAEPNCPTSWSVGTKNVSVVTHTGWRTSTGMREDICGQAPRALNHMSSRTDVPDGVATVDDP
jgi:hypothetical protein